MLKWGKLGGEVKGKPYGKEWRPSSSLHQELDVGNVKCNILIGYSIGDSCICEYGVRGRGLAGNIYVNF